MQEEPFNNTFLMVFGPMFQEFHLGKAVCQGNRNLNPGAVAYASWVFGMSFLLMSYVGNLKASLAQLRRQPAVETLQGVIDAGLPVNASVNQVAYLRAAPEGSLFRDFLPLVVPFNMSHE